MDTKANPSSLCIPLQWNNCQSYMASPIFSHGITKDITKGEPGEPEAQPVTTTAQSVLLA